MRKLGAMTKTLDKVGVNYKKRGEITRTYGSS